MLNETYCKDNDCIITTINSNRLWHDGNVANRVGNGNNVDKVISEQIDKTESENNSSDSEKDTNQTGGRFEERDCISEKVGMTSYTDYDLQI